MKHTFFKIRESKLFQYSVLFIIIFNAFTIGLNTYNLGEFTRELIKYLEVATLPAPKMIMLKLEIK